MNYFDLIRHVLANGLGMIISLAYQIMVGRALSGSDFARLQSMFSWQAVINGLFSYIVLVETMRIAHLESKNNYDEIKVRLRLLQLTTYILIFILTTSVLSALLLNNSNYVSWIAYFHYVALAFIYSLITAVTSGLRWFKVLSFQSLLPHATKFFVTLLLLRVGLEFTGVALALPASVILLNLILLWLLSREFDRTGVLPKTETGNSKREVKKTLFTKLFSLAVGHASLAAAMNLDIILCTQALTNEQSAPYIKLSVMTKVFMYLMGAMGGIILPAASHANNTGGSVKNIVLRTTFVSCLIGVVFIIGVRFTGADLANLVFSTSYEFSPFVLTIAAIFSVVTGIYIMLFNYLAALGRSNYNYICAGIIAAVISISYLIAPTIENILALATIAVSTNAFLGVALTYYRKV